MPRLRVRAATAADLHWLKPDATTDFLADQRFVTMPVTVTPNGFEFRARWSDQRERAQLSSTTWHLHVGIPAEEVRCDG
jgi:hypothetical protein